MNQQKEPASLSTKVSVNFYRIFFLIFLLGSIFACSNLSYREVLELMWFFAYDNTYEESAYHIEDPSSSTTLSHSTIYEWFHKFREAASYQINLWNAQMGLIGGEGIRVQIDETKVGHRKYHTGHLVDGQWVIGFVEEESKRFDCALCPGGKRNRATLEPIIRSKIALGSVIITDYWKGYDWISDPNSGYIHEKVNHSEGFAEYHEDGHTIHTNTIESCWRPVKDFFRRRKLREEHFFWALQEYRWRRMVKKKQMDRFLALADAIKSKFKPELFNYMQSDSSGIDLQ